MTIKIGPFALGVSPLGTQVIGALDVVYVGGPGVVEIGIPLALVELAAPALAPVGGTFTTVLTTTLTVLGPASNMWIVISFNGGEITGDRTPRWRVLVDGTPSGGFGVSLGVNEFHGMTFPLLVSAAPGDRVIALQWCIDGNAFGVDPTAAFQTQPYFDQQMSIFAVEVLA